ncbi:MAG: ribonuclease P protein component [Bacteroidetes bacterium]|nr:ribonuclease P protein component [Bacteroidota bacterium]
MGQFSFLKQERLYHKKQIQELFQKGSSFYLNPFKIIFWQTPGSTGVNQLLFSVPKTNFKKATDRNTVRRRIREAYRLNKRELEPAQNLSIAYIYTAREIKPSSFIHEKMIASLKKIKEKCIAAN